MDAYYRETWVEVDLEAIADNVRAIQRHIPSTSKVMAVVKADGYGHGAVQVARTALQHGASYLAVAMLDEALVLRRAGIEAPILVLGYTPPSAVRQAAVQQIELTAYHTDWIKAASKLLADETLPSVGIHVKVDTGMGRIGVVTDSQLLELVELLLDAPGLSWSGFYTHFACADEADTTHVQSQYDRFQQMLSLLKANGYELPAVHCCNTAAAIAFPEWGHDLVRLGIGLYGLYPSPYLKEQARVHLQPALQLKTRITHVKTTEKPASISYGATYVADQGEQIATLPIGYADGFSRSLSNRGYALHKGRRVPIVGRVCMDQTMIAIADKNADIGDEVVLYGRQGGEEIPLDEVGALLNTINYEVACMINYRVPRVYKQGGKIVEVCHHLRK